MRIYTATPRPFFKEGEPEDRFFSRDTGLLCRQFKKAGHESKVVMLDGPDVQAHPDILRVSVMDMEDPDFWRDLKLDAVVLYAWMQPCYLKIAQAINASGARLISRCDSMGLYDPRIDLFEYMRQEFYGYGSAVLTRNNFQRSLRAPLKTICRLMDRRYQNGVVTFSECCDSMLIESSLAKDRMVRFFKLYGRDDLAGRVRYVPHPVDVNPFSEGIGKEKLIIAVGRWDDTIKNGPLLIRVLVRTLLKHPDYRAVIIGGGTEPLRRKAGNAGLIDRIHFTGRIPHGEVQGWMRKAQIVLVTSRYESFNMAAAEARCLGASVVGSAHLPSIRDFAGGDGGTTGSRYSVGAFVVAVQAEIAAWERGDRDACSIKCWEINDYCC
ncbi:MAG: glycosyltransferase family 4 protein [Planctomycetes bacterium]|nr:glycosyltransferase family 4 protein [Planctomycetota bacterium]